MIRNPRSTATDCSSLVHPGSAATGHTYKDLRQIMFITLIMKHTFALFRLLMRLDLPTLGYPTTPTEMLLFGGLKLFKRFKSAGDVREDRFCL
jgi:hypothetical protein